MGVGPTSILRLALDLVYGDRGKKYGPAPDNHACTAAMFRAYLKRRFNVDLAIDGVDVSHFNSLQKISRDAFHRQPDNKIDLAGFADNAQQCEEALGTCPHCNQPTTLESIQREPRS